MRTTALPPVDRELLEQVRDFYADYTEVLDDERMPEWPGFFTDDCLYQIIPRENYDSQSELCTMQAEGKGMLLDRVSGMLTTQAFGPQRCRRFYSGLKIVSNSDGVISTRQNVLAIQSLLDQPSVILVCGAAYDQLRREDGELRIQRRIVVSDTEIISNALIYPL